MSSAVTGKDALALDRGKFDDPSHTMDGRPRAAVTLNRLKTL
jgi:hypothetical protein